MEKRIGVAGGIAALTPPVLFGIFEVMEWKMPNWLAVIFVSVTAIVGFIALLVLLHGLWIWSKSVRMHIGLQIPSPFYRKNKPNPNQWLIDLAERQRQTPQDFFAFTGQMAVGLSRNDKRPYLSVRCYYRNYSVHRWEIGELKGYVRWKNEQLPEEVKQDGSIQQIAPLEHIVFDWKVHIPSEYLVDLCIEYDSGEIKSLNLSGLTATLRVNSGDSDVRVSLGHPNDVIRINR